MAADRQAGIGLALEPTPNGKSADGPSSDSPLPDSDYYSSSPGFLPRSILKGASLALLARGVFTFASFIVALLIARAYGAEPVGVVATVTILMTLGGIIANVGTSSSVSFHVTAQMRVSTLNAFRAYRRILKICLGGILAVSLGLILLSGRVIEWSFGGLGGHVPLLLMVITIAAVPLRLISEMTVLVMRALNNVPAFAVLTALPALANLALLGAGLAFGGRWITAVWALVGGLAVSAVLGLAWVNRRFSQLADGKSEVDGPSTRQILSDSWPMLLSTIGAYVVTSTGVLIVSAMGTQAEAGQFAIALRIVAVTSLVLTSINSITTPIFARLHSGDELAELVRFARQTSRLMTLMLVPIIGALAIFGLPILRNVFGSQFGDAYIPLLILLAGQLVNAVTGPSDFLMTMTGKQTALRNIVVPVAVLSVVIGVTLVPIFGITGAALSYAVSLTVWNLTTAIFLRCCYGEWIAYIPFLTRNHSRIGGVG